MSYRDDVVGVRARNGELEEQLAVYRAAGPSGAEVRVAELQAQRDNLARLIRPYRWLLLEPALFLALRFVHEGPLADDWGARLGVLLVPPLLAVIHLAHALGRQTDAVRVRRHLAREAERRHVLARRATATAEARHAERAAALDAEIREMEDALDERTAALARRSAAAGAWPLLLVASAIVAAFGLERMSSFEPMWTWMAVVGTFSFLLGVTGLAARGALVSEMPRTVHPPALPGRARRARVEEAADGFVRSAPSTSGSVLTPVLELAGHGNGYALELARNEALERELAAFRRTGASGPAMRLRAIVHEGRILEARWRSFTWLLGDLALLAAARTQHLRLPFGLPLLDALLVPPAVVLVAFAVRAARQARALDRRLLFADQELSGAAAAPQAVSAAGAAGVAARIRDEEMYAGLVAAGRREQGSSFLLFAAAVIVLVSAATSMSPHAGARGVMLLGMIIGVSALTSLAALAFFTFVRVQGMHRQRLLAIARLALRLERKKLERARGLEAIADASALTPSDDATRLRIVLTPVAVAPPSEPSSGCLLDDDLGSLDEREEHNNLEPEASLAQRWPV